jgi:hypothetical protein
MSVLPALWSWNTAEASGCGKARPLYFGEAFREALENRRVFAAPPEAAWEARKPWRTDAIFQNLRKQHEEQWKEYDASDVAAREKFFDVFTDYVAYVNTLDAHLDRMESLFFWVRRTIVNRVIGYLQFDSTVRREGRGGVENF